MKRLLMVANYFPPMASGGIARQLRFLRYLPELGWEPTVLTCRATGPVPDPQGVRIVRTAAPGPDGVYALARRLKPVQDGGRHGAAPQSGTAEAIVSRVRPARRPGDFDPESLVADEKRYSRSKDINRWLFIPDRYVGWIGPAVLAGRRMLREEGYDAIFSSFPRASTHLVAASLAARSGLPWLADYRDPWPTHQFLIYKTPLHARAHFALERWALKHAAWATAVSESIADDLRHRHPGLRERVTVIPNGFDALEQAEDVELGPGFWLVHTGRLYSRGRQVTALLDALAEQDDDVRILFVGVEGPRIRAYAESIGIGDRVSTEPYVAHARALGFQRAADALLLVTGPSSTALSSKIFEYLVSGRPVFAMTPATSGAASLLAEAGGGYRPASDRPLADELRRFIGLAREARFTPPDQAVVDRYDGRKLTGRLAELLDRIAT